MLWNVLLNCTSILGTMYDPSSLTCVRNGDSWWQNCIGVQTLLLAALRIGFGTVVVLPNSTSGTFAAISQLSVVVFPESSPPCRVTLLGSRALTVTAIPFQWLIWLP